MFKWLGGLVDSNEKAVKRFDKTIERINALEPQMQALSNEQLRAKTDEFRGRLKNGEEMDAVLDEAFAAVREAGKRSLSQRHFDVQLIGGIVLHLGRIAEMKTGEGKTLVATLPSYLNALDGKGVHVVTVNDYLSKRDCQWMGPIYHMLGISVATIQHEASFVYDPTYVTEDKSWPHLRPVTRREAYAADITYGTNNEFGFDYLRDNMVVDLSQCVQRELNYAIVDEVDYILIDEARTPLIISGPALDAADKYKIFSRLTLSLLAAQDYEIEEREKTVKLTDEGMSKMEDMLRREGLLKGPDLYDPANYLLTHYLESALKARVLFKRDREYVIKNGEVIIVDEFTGRMMPGRRYSEGLHQAIEAKEGVKVERESTTMATITFQNYFRMYDKLAGMTGTAVTEEIKKLHGEGKPVLVGTASIERSEHLSEMLLRKGIPHEVLNAKNHEKEAAIVAQAGGVDAVMVATNMAGRGVDIILGGKPPLRESFENEAEFKKKYDEWQAEHDKVVQLGGLHIIGTERHEARRIDNQLRGRSGRQGDPGSTRFYVSLEDEVVRRFGGDRIKGIMERFKLDEDMPIENSMVTRAVEESQKKIEGYHFDIRKHLVDYDDVINKHREVIYEERKKILSGADMKANIKSMVEKEICGICELFLGKDRAADWDAGPFLKEISNILPAPPDINAAAVKTMNKAAVEERLLKYADEMYEQHEKDFGADKMRLLERLVMLRTIDKAWVEHLTSMEQMRQSAGLEAIGQRDPLVIYKGRGHEAFEALTAGIEYDIAHTIFKVKIEERQAPSPMAQAAVRGEKAHATDKPGRNDLCPCGSGKKYKKCCGK